LIMGGFYGTVEVWHLLSNWCPTYDEALLIIIFLLLNQIRDLHTKSLVRRVPDLLLSPINSICSHPERAVLVTTGSRGIVRLWNWNPTTLRYWLLLVVGQLIHDELAYQRLSEYIVRRWGKYMCLRAVMLQCTDCITASSLLIILLEYSDRGMPKNMNIYTPLSSKDCAVRTTFFIYWKQSSGFFPSSYV
jgi:WD40 repeat protein